MFPNFISRSAQARIHCEIHACYAVLCWKLCFSDYLACFYFTPLHLTSIYSPLLRWPNLWAYYNCESSSIRLQHATTRYEVFRALAYDIDSSTPRESVVGVSCMLSDSSMHTIFTLYLYRPTLHRVCEYARNCLYKRN